MRRLLLLLIATAGCVQPTHVDGPRAVTRPIDLRQLCTDAEYRSMCAPASYDPATPPIQIDTNFATPTARNIPALG